MEHACVMTWVGTVWCVMTRPFWGLSHVSLSQAGAGSRWRLAVGACLCQMVHGPATAQFADVCMAMGMAVALRVCVPLFALRSWGTVLGCAAKGSSTVCLGARPSPKALMSGCDHRSWRPHSVPQAAGSMRLGS